MYVNMFSYIDISMLVFLYIYIVYICFTLSTYININERFFFNRTNNGMQSL